MRTTPGAIRTTATEILSPDEDFFTHFSRQYEHRATPRLPWPAEKQRPRVTHNGDYYVKITERCFHARGWGPGCYTPSIGRSVGEGIYVCLFSIVQAFTPVV